MVTVPRNLVEEAPAIFAVGTFGLMMLFGVLGFGRLAGIVMVVGWFILTPLSAIFQDTLLESSDDDFEVNVGTTNETTQTTQTSAPDDPVERLRQRYANGEIDEVEFERRLDALLETEGTDAETARDRLRQNSSASVEEELEDLVSDAGRERERERERGRE
jgi:uncharacterized membrane protein